MRTVLRALDLETVSTFYHGPDGQEVGQEGLRSFARNQLNISSPLKFDGQGGGLAERETALVLSTIHVLTTFLESNNRTLLLIEDDVGAYVNDTVSTARVLREEVFRLDPDSYHVVWLEHFLHFRHVELDGPAGRLKRLRVKSRDAWVWGLGAMLYSRRGAQLVLDYAYRNLHLPMDHIIGRVLTAHMAYPHRAGAVGWIAEPSLFAQLRPRFPSEVHPPAQDTYVLLQEAKAHFAQTGSVDSPRLQAALERLLQQFAQDVTGALHDGQQEVEWELLVEVMCAFNQQPLPSNFWSRIITWHDARKDI
eukprot:g38876.t1